MQALEQQPTELEEGVISNSAIFAQYFNTNEARVMYKKAKQVLKALEKKGQKVKQNSPEHIEICAQIDLLGGMLRDIDEFLELMTTDATFAAEAAPVMAEAIDRFIKYMKKLAFNLDGEPAKRNTNTIVYLPSVGVNLPANGVGLKNKIAVDLKGFAASDIPSIRKLFSQLADSGDIFANERGGQHLRETVGQARGYFVKLADGVLLLLGVYRYNASTKQKVHDAIDERFSSAEVQEIIAELRTLFASGNNVALAEFLIKNAAIEGAVFEQLDKGKNNRKAY